jgi:hypothetical protein
MLLSLHGKFPFRSRYRSGCKDARSHLHLPMQSGIPLLQPRPGFTPFHGMEVQRGIFGGILYEAEIILMNARYKRCTV